ncbi:MAG: ABC transporter ATP-binding protein [Gammaproteobacteria bacterium]|nr:ABC transporter ATP-binding protein [Gammaproteobacteria bacterium]
MQTVIEFEDVSFSYGHSRVLEDVSLCIGQGEFFGLIGPNAGGKSTLLKLMLGLLTPDQGKLSVFGKSPMARRSRIGYVPQYPSYVRNFPITVEDVVTLGRLAVTSSIIGFNKVDKAFTHKALKAVEIDGIAKRQIDTLSGGQAQRMLIARALVSEPEILVLDEPTANIDVRAEEDIFALLKQYNEHMTIIMVSHDIGFISGYVDRVGCLNRTLVCHNTEDISGKIIDELYGAPMKMIDHAHTH